MRHALGDFVESSQRIFDARFEIGRASCRERV